MQTTRDDRRRADDTRVRLRWRFQVADDIRRPDVIRTSSAHRSQAGMSSTCCSHMHTSSAHRLPVIHTTPHGQCGPELSFTVTGICYLMEFVAGMLNCFISGSCK